MAIQLVHAVTATQANAVAAVRVLKSAQRKMIPEKKIASTRNRAHRRAV